MDAEIVTSFATCPGTRDAAGVWTPVEAKKVLAYTQLVGGKIAAAEFMNEPTYAAMGGAPGKTAKAARTKDKPSAAASHQPAKSGGGSDPRSANLKALLPDLWGSFTRTSTRIPRLSMQETRTAGIVAKRLKAAGYEVTTKVGKTGVVGLLHNDDGPTVMLRADMDALPVKEATGLPYTRAKSP